MSTQSGEEGRGEGIGSGGAGGAGGGGGGGWRERGVGRSDRQKDEGKDGGWEERETNHPLFYFFFVG